jgi:hypothetical protein
MDGDGNLPGVSMPGAVQTLRMVALSRRATGHGDNSGYTTMTQITSETLDLPVDRIHAFLGDSRLPPAPVSGGSMTTASVTPAVKAACEDAISKLIRLATEDARSSFFKMPAQSIVFSDGRIRSSDGKTEQAYDEVIRNSGAAHVRGESFVRPGAEQRQFSFHSFGAQFAKVHVDPELGPVRGADGQRVRRRSRDQRENRAQPGIQRIIQGSMALAVSNHDDTKRRATVSTAHGPNICVPVNAMPGRCHLPTPDFRSARLGERDGW